MTEQEKFNLISRNIDGIECFYLKGYLDAHTAPKLESTFENTINSGNFKILVNFRDLEYISSAGLGVFMSFIEEIREKGGDIKLSDMKPKVFSVFDLLGFPLLFDIENEDSIALSKFESSQK